MAKEKDMKRYELSNNELAEELLKRGFFVQKVGKESQLNDTEYLLVSAYPPKQPPHPMDRHN